MGLEFRVQDLGFGVYGKGSGFRVWASSEAVQDLGSRVQDHYKNNQNSQK